MQFSVFGASMNNWNKPVRGLTNTFCFVVAACGIPFQVLPDYKEGAEQVSE